MKSVNLSRQSYSGRSSHLALTTLDKRCVKTRDIASLGIASLLVDFYHSKPTQSSFKTTSFLQNIDIISEQNGERRC